MSTTEIARKLMQCQLALIEAQKITGHQMLSLWNPDERRYENPELLGALHAIANQHLITVTIIRLLIEEVNSLRPLTSAQN